MLRNLNIAQKITLLILLGVGAILATVGYFDHRSVRKLLEDELQVKARTIAAATARQMQIVEKAVQKVVEQIGIVLENSSLSTEQLYRILEATVRQHEEIDGSAIVLEEISSERAARAAVIPYAYRQGSAIARKDLSSEGYRYETRDWYLLPRQSKAPVWTEPYFDEGGADSLMVTFSVPVLARPGGEFRGVVTGDVTLDWLAGMVKSMQLGEHGYAVLLSRKGHFLSHPLREFILRESLFNLADKYGDQEMRAVAQRMLNGDSGFLRFRSLVTGEPSWFAYAPVPGPDWSLVTVFPEKELMARVHSLSHRKLIVGGLGSLALVGVALWIARSITRPIRELEAATRVLAGGNLDATLPALQGNDEVSRLSRSFSRMQGDLKKHVEDLQAATAARVRMESDLQIARDIQMGLVPRRFSFEPPRPEVEIHALLDPAREVGGDFYDFFWRGDRLFFSVADVSGKGTPAALFMAHSMAFLQAFVKQGLSPAAALGRLNDELAPDNESCMFLTVFCGMLDAKTGDCAYACGGHNPPWILRRSGSVDVLPKGDGGLIGTSEDQSFGEEATRLEPGDVLLACTDGVFEAENPEQALYGEERVAERLRSLAGRTPEEIVRGLREDVLAFSGTAPQSDDITILALAFRGGESRPPRQSFQPSR